METRLTCRGRSCHYLTVGRKPETLMAKFTTLTTLTSARAGSTPETGRTARGQVPSTFDLWQIVKAHTCDKYMMC